LLANAAIASSADVTDIGMSLAQVGGIAKGFGVSIDDTVAALGMLANAGIKGSDAGTLLKTTMQSITDQGNPAQGAIKDLGLELYKLTATGDKQFVGFRELFVQLDEAKKRMTSEDFQADANILFGSDAMRAAMLGNGEAFDKMFNDLQRVGGGAELAGAQMQGLPGAVEAFKNTVESVQLSAFEAIGPSLTKGLNEFVAWTGDHKPELIGLFSGMAQAAIGTGEAIALMSAGALKALASLSGGIGNTLATLARGAALVADVTGADGTAKDLREFADSAYGWGESLYTAGELALEAGTKMGDLRESIAAASDGIIAKEELLRALGKSSLSIFEGREIVIKDNTPEVTERLKALGFEIRKMPDGQFEVVPITEPARLQLDQFRRDYTAPIRPEFDVDPAKARATLSRLLSEYPQFTGAGSLIAPPGAVPPGPNVSAPANVGPPANLGPLGPLLLPKPRAAGGVFGSMPSSAMIQPATPGLVQWAEPSTAGEAFIPLAASKRPRSKRILEAVAQLFGLSVMEDGGVTVDALKQFASQLSGGKYVRGGPPGPDGTDCSGAQSWIANLLTGGQGRFATGTESAALLSRGFQQGDPPAGISAYWVGWKNGGPGGGHTAGTIVDPLGGNVNVEMGGASGGGQFGGSAAGASEFPNRAWIQIAGGEDPNAPKTFSGSSAAVQSAGAAVTRSKASVTSAQASLDQAQAAVDEAKATGKSADKVAVAEKKRDAAQQKLDAAQEKQTAAESKLTEVKEKAADQTDKSKSKGMDGESLGKSIFSGILQGTGLDGSVFSNPFDWPNFKSGVALANWAGGLLKSWTGPGEEDGSTTTPAGGGGGIPGIQPIGPQAITPISQPDAPHPGTGAPPGPAVVVNGNVGMDPRAFTDRVGAANNASWRKHMGAVRPA
jgi:hypothetical protein